MQKIIKITFVITLYATAALCTYCLYLSQDYNRFYPQTKEQTAQRMLEGK